MDGMATVWYTYLQFETNQKLDAYYIKLEDCMNRNFPYGERKQAEWVLKSIFKTNTEEAMTSCSSIRPAPLKATDAVVNLFK